MIKCIGCLIYDIEKDMFLLQQRGKNTSHPMKLGLWGGKMEQGEMFALSLKREIKEELGDVPFIKKLYPLDVFLSKDGSFIYYSFLLITSNYENICINNKETFDFVWMPLKLISRLDLHPGFRKTFEKKKDYIRDVIEKYKKGQ